MFEVLEDISFLAGRSNARCRVRRGRDRSLTFRFNLVGPVPPTCGPCRVKANLIPLNTAIPNDRVRGVGASRGYREVQRAVDFLGLILRPAEIAVFLTHRGLEPSVNKVQFVTQNLIGAADPVDCVKDAPVQRAARLPRPLWYGQIGDIFAHDADGTGCRADCKHANCEDLQSGCQGDLLGFQIKRDSALHIGRQAQTVATR